MLVLSFPTRTLALSEADFLPPEEAFRMSAQMIAPDVLEVSWDIAPGYYMYHEQFAFTAEPPGVLAPGAVQIPPGKVMYDAVFEKDLETHRDAIAIRIGLAGPPGSVQLSTTSQGCADAGLCYPPQTQTVSLTAADAGGWQLAQAAGAGFAWAGLLAANDVGLAEALGQAAAWQTVGVFFVLGVLLSLTPCVLPMLPILSSILVGDSQRLDVAGKPRRLRGLALAAAYVLGMSLVYTAAGVAAGVTGASLAAALQTPWILAVFAGLLIILALAMFDVFTVQVPGRWQAALSGWANRLPGGRFTGAFGMGAISALIVGPCVAAPLAGALLYISQTGDLWLGAIALFALSWGMGVTLLLAGVSAGSLLPRAGAWMDGVKRFFGVLLLAVAWWMLLPVLPTWVQMLGWVVLAFFAASLLRAFDALPADAGAGLRFLKGIGWLFAVAGVLQAVGLASGGRDPLQPLVHLVARTPAALTQAAGGSASSPAPASGVLAALTASGSRPAGAVQPGQAAATRAVGPLSFVQVSSTAELDALIAANRGRPVMLDFYADWCVSCKEMERFTFSDPSVVQRMQKMVLVQADVTANNVEHRALLKRFRLFGPPGIIFFDADGREQSATRVIGFQNPGRFAPVLDKVLAGT
nr:protein-disulfide reductase DsbD [Pseudomonas sp.]